MTGLRRCCTLVALALCAAVLAACQGQQAQEFDVELARAHNLFTGSPVKVLGVEVGRVHSLTSAEGSEAVTARVRIDPEVAVPADATAQVVQGTVLGERFIQLGPAYTEGPRLESGDTIPLERTSVPAEFDELLASLKTFLDGLPPEEVDRFLVNVAETLAGQGEQLGRTLESTANAVEVLRDNDDELVDLLVGVADLTETLGSRDEQLRALLGDYAQLTGTLADERDAIDAALSETARLLVEVEDLLEEQGGKLGASTEVLTRVGRTIDRNHTEVQRAIRGQAELYRHAERVFDRERNWLPLINHSEDMGRLLSERLAHRFAGLCERAGLPDCAEQGYWTSQMPVRVCLDPVFSCEVPEGEEEAVPFEDAVGDAIERVPELEEELSTPAEPDAQDQDDESGADDGVGDDPASALEELLGATLGGGG
jgi:virulence factor Mce-like protein